MKTGKLNVHINVGEKWKFSSKLKATAIARA
jgi:hypothetical protein